MKKKLPQIKKGLKEFINDEDAKVIDKSTIKVSAIISFLSFSILSYMDNANAAFYEDHSDHTNHGNQVQTPDDGLHNPTLENVKFTAGASQKTLYSKSMGSLHANHFNHQDSESFNWNRLAVGVLVSGLLAGGFFMFSTQITKIGYNLIG